VSLGMRLRYRAARKPLLRAPLVWLRHRGLGSTDVVLASYPRSGNTWIRFVLGDVLAGGSSFDTIQCLIPEMGVHGGARAVLPGGDRLIKTHDRYRREYRRGIYIVRDLRPVLLSNFRRETLDDLIGPLSLGRYVADFLAGKATRYGSWQDHVNQWLDSPLAADGDLLVLRYEDMRREFESVLIRVLDFLGVAVDLAAVRTAALNNTIDKMRTKEDTAARLPKSASEQGRWIGRGSIGWREEFTVEQLQLIDDVAGPTLTRLGYPTAVGQDCDELIPVPFPKVRSYSDFRAAKSAQRDTPTLKKRVGGWVAGTSSWYRY
jgi:hypothetical protein